MKKTEIIDEIRVSVTNNILKIINEMNGLSKTSFTSAELMMKFPIEFNFVQNDIAEVPKTKQLSDLDNLFMSYTAFEDTTKVCFELHYDDKKSLKRLKNIAIKHPEYFAYKFLYEVHGAIRQHNTYSYVRTMMKELEGISNPYELIADANDIYISLLLNKILEIANYDTKKLSILKRSIPTSDTNIPFNNTSDRAKAVELNKTIRQMNLDISNYSEVDILKIISKNNHKIKPTKVQKWVKQAKIKAQEYTPPKKKYGRTSLDLDEYMFSRGAKKSDVSVVDLASALMDAISTATKGTGVGDIFNASFKSLQTAALWFEELSRNLENSIIDKSRDDFSSWTQLSNTKRHLYNAPMRAGKDNKIGLIVSIDQSGSVQTEELQRILSIFEQYSDLISDAHVMIHTASVIKQFHLNDPENIANHHQFSDAFSRHGSGGTSHLDVFKQIDKLDIEDPSKYIYLSFSDNYSDIEETIFKYPVMHEFDKYWIRPKDGKDIKTEIVGGTNIITP